MTIDKMIIEMIDSLWRAKHIFYRDTTPYLQGEITDIKIGNKYIDLKSMKNNQ